MFENFITFKSESYKALNEVLNLQIFFEIGTSVGKSAKKGKRNQLVIDAKRKGTLRGIVPKGKSVYMIFKMCRKKVRTLATDLIKKSVLYNRIIKLMLKRSS